MSFVFLLSGRATVTAPAAAAQTNMSPVADCVACGIAAGVVRAQQAAAEAGTAAGCT